VRAIIITKPGGVDVLEQREVHTPAAGPGQVLVQISAFGVNRADLLQRRGLYPAPSDSPADIPGLEFAGVVHSHGPGVHGWTAGDRVMGIAGGGSYAEFLVTPADQLLRIPGGMSFEEAAAVPEAFLTAHDALEQLGVVAGEWVLVHAVGSGVGTAAVQLVRARGAMCVGTSRTAHKLARAAELGMDAGVEMTADTDLVAAVKSATGRGVNAVVDLVAGAGFGNTLRCMAPRGRVVVVGLTGGVKAEVDLGLILRNRLQIVGTVLRSRSKEDKAVLTRSFAETALAWFGEGRLVPVVDKVFGFDAVADAHLYMESNVNFGKVVVTLSQ
jgi:putative PIG3 family NAD(P)H quinone oxidoreductase